MASLSVGQTIAVSFNAVLNEKRGAANQWAESALLRYMEKKGFIKRESLGALLEWTLDYQRNPSFLFQPTELYPISLAKTEVLTAGTNDIAEISGSIVWTKKDEVKNSSRSEKIKLTKALITNAIDTHDDLLEQALFAANTNGFYGLPTHIPQNGQGVDEGVDASVNTWWRNPSNTYVDDTDIEAGATTTYNQCAKGTGSSLKPTAMFSDGPTQALFEGTQQAYQRWENTNEANAGFKVLKFKDCDWVYSQYGSSSIYFTNPKNLQVIVAKDYFRELGETEPLQNGQGYRKLVYTACQMGTDNKSRLGLLHI